jgi:PAS domain S-box-containing protein
MGALTLKSYRETNETAFSIHRSRQVLELADEIGSASKSLQLESNAYFVNRDTAQLRNYNEAKKTVSAAMQQLESLTGDNPVQQQELKALRLLISDLIFYTDSALLTQSWTVETLMARVTKNTIYRNQVEKTLDSFKGEENNLLTAQQSSNQTSIESSTKLTIALLAFVMLVIAATFLSIRYHFNRRMVAETELTKANELFYKLFYESPVGLVISNTTNGSIIDCNAAYAKLINIPREHIVGHTAKSLQIVEDDPGSKDYTSRPHGEEIARDEAVRIRPKGREPIWVDASVQSIQLKEKDCLLSAVVDVSAHKEAEARIQLNLKKEIELNNLKSNFVSMASHEFRTPLTTIMSSAFLLENYLPESVKDKSTKHISRIRTAVNTLTNILDEFLSLTKIEEGKSTPVREDIDIKALFTAICPAQETYAKPGQHIAYEHSGDRSCWSDPGILTGIATNLISNASKYSPENSTICISTNIRDGKLELIVKDQGVGIPIKDQEHLFERFYRASNAGNVQGTGLGLHVTKHYVKQLGGSITFESQPGVGSIFKVNLESGRPST